MFFYEILKQARKDSKKTQQEVADRLGISRKTYQNWEQNLTCPSANEVVNIFNAMGLSPLPYLFAFLYPKDFNELNNNSTDTELENALVKLIRDCLTPEMKRKLLYCLMGNHGSSAPAIIDLLTAHLHTPLENRLNISNSVITNFKVAKQKETLVGKEHIMPDLEFLEKATERGIEAVMNGDVSYTALL